MAREFKTLDKISTLSAEEMAEVHEIGEKTAKNIEEFFKLDKNIEIIEKLKAAGVNTEHKEEENSGAGLSGLKIVITGTMEGVSRAEIVKLIEQNGGTSVGSVSKKTDLLVAGEDAGSKLTKAQSLGIKIISYEELLNMI